MTARCRGAHIFDTGRLSCCDVSAQVSIEFMDLYSHLIPVYEIEPLEKITDWCGQWPGQALLWG
jgi:hypothetical protein